MQYEAQGALLKLQMSLQVLDEIVNKVKKARCDAGIPSAYYTCQSTQWYRHRGKGFSSIV